MSAESSAIARMFWKSTSEITANLRQENQKHQKFKRLTGYNVPTVLYYYSNRTALTVFELNVNHPGEGRHFIRKGNMPGKPDVYVFRCAGKNKDGDLCQTKVYATMFSFN